MSSAMNKPVYKLAVGDTAPDFKLLGTADGAGRGQGFREYSLSQWRGQSVVLVFYPAAYTPV